jgi:acetoacetyl-CoA synthetase
MSQDLFASSGLLSKPVTIEDTKVELLRRLINRKHGLHLSAYHVFTMLLQRLTGAQRITPSCTNTLSLTTRSGSTYGNSWASFLQFHQPRSALFPHIPNAYTSIIAQVLEEGYIKEVPRWFPGARLNYAENLLWRTDDGIAITETNETGHVASYTYRELREMVRKFAVALKHHGLQPGDRVAGWSFGLTLDGRYSHTAAIIANRTTSIAIALATASLGGIFTSTATDMGVKVSPYVLTWRSSPLTSVKGNSRPIPTNTPQVHLF